jgi:photosystem II stability/assembly factor-like uncharacterized protein
MQPAIDVYVTHDSGATWSSTTPLPYTSTADSPIWAFSDQLHGLVTIGTTQYRTVDGGHHWSASDTNLGIQRVMQLEFVNAGVGWALGAAPVGTCVFGDIGAR